VKSHSGYYKYDDSAGKGTFVYQVDHGFSPQHNEFSEVKIRPLFPGPYPVNVVMENDDKKYHGTKCLGKAVGKNVGIARRAEEVVATVWDFNKQIYETWLDGLVKVHEDIRSKARGTRSVVSISISIHYKLMPKVTIDRFGKLH
jgi:subtilisin family serine protease